jgi:hypothetical protein
MNGDFKEDLQKSALEAALKALEAKAASLVCPIHGKSPKLKMNEGAGPGHQNMGFDCCCDTLAKMMKETLET